jgi:hypothetical protein
VTVLISEESSSGRRRCDAHCHTARDAKCTCICGGAYHGISQAGAEALLRNGQVQLGLFADETGAATPPLSSQAFRDTNPASSPPSSPAGPGPQGLPAGDAHGGASSHSHPSHTNQTAVAPGNDGRTSRRNDV